MKSNVNLPMIIIQYIFNTKTCFLLSHIISYQMILTLATFVYQTISTYIKNTSTFRKYIVNKINLKRIPVSHIIYQLLLLFLLTSLSHPLIIIIINT